MPGEKDAALMAVMENILDLSWLPYDVAYPVAGMDAKPWQRLEEVREPISMEPGKPCDVAGINHGPCMIGGVNQRRKILRFKIIISQTYSCCNLIFGWFFY